MKITKLISVAIVMILFVSSCFNAAGPEPKVAANTDETNHTHQPLSVSDSIKYISNNVEVNGDVVNELNLTVDSLKKMKVVTLNQLNVVCQSGATTKTDTTSKGVLLKDILEKAVLKQTNHKDRNFVIVARATDGYKATFSWAELFNNPTGDNTYILFEENGRPIVNHGEMILICANDIKTGPRHVIWLKSIEVSRIK